MRKMKIKLSDERKKKRKRLSGNKVKEINE